MMGFNIAELGHTYKYSARDRVSDLLIRKHGIITAVRAVEVYVHGFTQSYPFNTLDPEIDVGELCPNVVRTPGRVCNLLYSLETRAPN
jgi:hypothetical protein